MEGGNIQLPFGYVRDENEGGEIQFTLSFNFKKDILFEKLTHVYHLQNQALDNTLKSGKADDIDLQKYLLATGLMQDAIQENLNMVVIDGDFNTASIRIFDVQNPVVGWLIAQVHKSKEEERAYLEQLNQVPSITDLNIAKRLKELKNFNEGRINDDNSDNDDEDGPPAIPPTPPAPTSSFRSRPSGIFPTPPHTQADDDDNDTNLNPTQCFLLQRLQTGGERVAEAIGQELSRTTPQRVTFSNNITRIFPQARKIIEKTDDIVKAEDDADIAELRMVARELNHGKEPQKLKLFSGGEKEGMELIAIARCRLGFLSQENKKFIKYLTTPIFGPQILSKNNIKIHLETGTFYVNNRMTGESLYNFLQIQQDNTKKLLKVKLNIDGDLEYYFNEILSNIENDDDFRTNSISKFLFYNLNTLRVCEGKKPLLLRHSKMSDDEFALERFQSKSWSYFIESLIDISNDDMKYVKAIENEVESDIIEKTIDNLDYCKDTYNQS